ncbi:MAG: efflux RND transporter permease subunit [Parasphingorhabdus sp.]|nr:efflux RND transporter permease subunit [Parasphingorhabdus sp.]
MKLASPWWQRPASSAVFLPVGLMPGIAGQFFENFGLTVVVSVLMSLAVARIITPMIAAYFLKAKAHADHGGGNGLQNIWTCWHGRLTIAKPKRRLQGAGLADLARFRHHRSGYGHRSFSLFADNLLFAITPQQFQPTVNVDDSRIRIEMVPVRRLSRPKSLLTKWRN